MNKFSHIAVAVAFLCRSVAVQGQVLSPPVSFDCDVPPGRASYWAGRLDSHEVKVQGTIEFIETREHDQWWPVASVFLIGDAKGFGTGLQLYVELGKPSELQVAIINPHDPAGRTAFAAYPWKGNPIKFVVTMSKSGELKVAVGEASAALTLTDFALSQLLLSCSTAEVKFTDVLVTE